MMSDEEENGISLEKEIIFVAKLHETLVNNFDLEPVSINLRKDPDFGYQAGDFILKYDLGFGDELIVTCRREGGNMLITLDSGGRQMHYSIPLDLYVDDDFMPVVDEEFEKLISDWFE